MSLLSIRNALGLHGAMSIINDLVGRKLGKVSTSLRQAVEHAQSFERFFLDEIASDDQFFRPPRRTSCAVEPLIDRAHALQAMERPIMEAQSTVFMAGWLFFPNTPLQDPAVRKKIAARTWLDLIRFVLTKKEKVKVRIIISDLDPFFAPSKHRFCWSAMSQLEKMQKELPSDRRDNLEYIASRHGFFIDIGVMKKIIEGLFSVTDPIKSLIAEYNKMAFSDALKLYRNTPGHWDSISVDSAKKRFSMHTSPETRAFIASHHQKLCVVDSRIAFCGGMDITPFVLDTMDHEFRQRKGAWHDIHSSIKGEVVTDIERGFRERWNVEMRLFEGRVMVMRSVKPDKGILPVTKLTMAPDPASRSDKAPGTDVVQALRTVSVDQRLLPLPKTKCADILDAYSQAIGEARKFVYLENQYFRASEFTDLLIDRHKEMPRLQVILVIPIAPEELTDLKSADIRDLHPVAVQIKEIERLMDALGSNFGVFSLVVRAKAEKKKFTDAHGSPQLYVHSKICIIDDQFATIGSANINGRSLKMDTELNVGWFHKTRVREFRIKLWVHLLGCLVPQTSEAGSQVIYRAMAKDRSVKRKGRAGIPERLSHPTRLQSTELSVESASSGSRNIHQCR